MDDVPIASRNLSGALLLGMLTIWPLVIWLFLRRGYSRSLRVAAFTYGGVQLALGVFRMVFGGY